MDQSFSMNLLGRISHFFTLNRSLSILLLVTVLLFGLISFWLTPKQYNPEIIRPAFVISMQYEGATVDASVERVVFELVEKVRTVPGVDDIYTEVRDGSTINTTVIFEVDYDATDAKLDLLAQINQHKYLRSGLVSEPQIREVNPETIPVLQVVFASDELAIDEVRSRVVALSHMIGGVAEVSEVSVHGGYVPSLVVQADVGQLAEAGIGLDELSATLQASQQRVLSKGIQTEALRLEVVFDATAESPEAIGSLVIRDGIRVRDVASVYLGTAGERSYVFHQSENGLGEVVVLAVSKREGSSAPVVTTAVKESIDTLLQQPNFAPLEYKVVGDDGATAFNEISGLTQNLFTSIAIVAIVLMLFLSTRTALVVLVAIPVTLLIVFGLGFLFGETINRITLFALILSLGLLVDSAIVVVENIHSHLREWRTGDRAMPRERIIAGAVHEIGVGLLLSTITSVIVFLPMGFITGMMGPYMGPIAFFVPVALLVSLLVAVVITPFVASHLITGEESPNRLNRYFSGLMSVLTLRYTTFLRWVLRDRHIQRWLLRGVFGLFAFALIFPLTGLVHFQMLPKADRDQFYLYIDLPVESSVEATTEFSRLVVDLLLTDDTVTQAQLYVGQPSVVDFNGMFKGSQNRFHSHQSTIRVNLIEAGERSRSSTDVVNDLRALIQTHFEDSYQFIRFIEEPPGPPVRATFVMKVSAPDATLRTDTAERLRTAVATIPGIVDLYSSDEITVGRIEYQFDHEAGARLGVSVDSVVAAVQALSGSQVVTEFVASEHSEFTPIVLSVASDQRNTPAAIQGLRVSSRTGELISVTSVLSVETNPRPSTVWLEDVSAVTYVTAEVEERSIVYVMIDVFRALLAGQVTDLTVTDWNLFTMTLVDQVSGEVVEVGWGGEWEMTLENFRDLGVAMGVALLLVYAVLVAQYNRFSTPAYILVTVPLGLVGILLGFFVLDSLFGIYLTATALIGFIALIGIVVNNAIIFLEYVEQMRIAGHTFEESLVKAGAARLRPILLTSLTTVLASLTIAGDPVWSGLAWAIVFGLSLSTVLTLVIYPTLLMYFTNKNTTN